MKQKTRRSLTVLLAALLLCLCLGAAAAESIGQYEPYVPEYMPYIAFASSEYQLKYNTEYTVGADMAVDGDLTTAWNEGAPGNGIGEWIRLFPADGGRYTYQGYKIANGFQYHDYWKGDRWVKNNRVQYLLVLNDMGMVVGHHRIEDIASGCQIIYFDEPVSTSYLEFRIAAVWEGDKFSETCISEIQPF